MASNALLNQMNVANAHRMRNMGWIHPQDASRYQTLSLVAVKEKPQSLPKEVPYFSLLQLQISPIALCLLDRYLCIDTTPSNGQTFLTGLSSTDISALPS